MLTSILQVSELFLHQSPPTLCPFQEQFPGLPLINLTLACYCTSEEDRLAIKPPCRGSALSQAPTIGFHEEEGELASPEKSGKRAKVDL